MGTPGFTASSTLGRTSAASSAVRQIAQRGNLNAIASHRSLGGDATLRPQQFETSYTCESTTNHCNCHGVLDCLDMIKSGDCHGGTRVCDDNGCSCKWH